MIGIVGCGLLGGSLARALKAPRRATPRDRDRARFERRGGARRAENVVDEAHSEPCAALAACYLVVLCAPIAVIERALGPVSSLMRDGAVLSDVAGVKTTIAAAARTEVRRGVRFVGAHPMFGGETGGYEASAGRLVAWRKGRPCVPTTSTRGRSSASWSFIAGSARRPSRARPTTTTRRWPSCRIFPTSSRPRSSARRPVNWRARSPGEGSPISRGWRDLASKFKARSPVGIPTFARRRRAFRDELAALLDALDGAGDAHARFAKKAASASAPPPGEGADGAEDAPPRGTWRPRLPTVSHDIRENERSPQGER